MPEFVYFLHPPRDDFAATMTAEERAAFAAHGQWLARLHADGVLIVAGVSLGSANTGVAIIEAPDDEAARRIVAEDPATQGGVVRGEVRPFRLGFLRGRA